MKNCQEATNLATPRRWFPKEYPRAIMFIPSYFVNRALFRMRGIRPEVFKFDGIVSVSTEEAKKLADIEDKEKNMSVKITLGHRPSVHVRHPLTNVLSIDAPTKRFDEIIEDAMDLTGSPELFPELVIHDFGWRFKIPRLLEDEIQGVDSLYQYVRHRGYHTKPMDQLLGIRFFKPARTMELYIEANPEIKDAVKRIMERLGVEGNPFDLRRWRSILETKWITGDTKGFFEFSEHLLSLQEELIRNKFDQDIAVYHQIANQFLEDHRIQVGGHIYELQRIAEADLYSPLIPLWHEEIPKGMIIQ